MGSLKKGGDMTPTETDRYYYGKRVSAQPILRSNGLGDSEWYEYIPFIDGDERGGARVYLSIDDAFQCAKDKAKAAWHRQHPDAPSTDWECAGSPRRPDGGWDWQAIVDWHHSAVLANVTPSV